MKTAISFQPSALNCRKARACACDGRLGCPRSDAKKTRHFARLVHRTVLPTQAANFETLKLPKL